MTHNYDIEQIRQAWNETRKNHGQIMSEWDEMFRPSQDFIQDFTQHLLDALPEPAQDDWQQCTANELQDGDLYRAESSDANIEYKQPITKCAIVGDWVEVQHVGGMKSSARISSNTFYRIPAPINHPDPEQHPVIYVKECDLVNFIPKIMVWYRDSYVAGQQCLSPERITDWSPIDPAKVVETND